MLSYVWQKWGEKSAKRGSKMARIEVRKRGEKRARAGKKRGEKAAQRGTKRGVGKLVSQCHH